MRKFINSHSVKLTHYITLVVLMALAALPASAAENYKPVQVPLIHGEQKFKFPDNSLKISDDDRPLGVNLSKITLIQAGVGEFNQTAKLATKLNGFLQQPLSFKLIAQVRASVTEYFRSIDRPFVSVVIPPQEVSGGELRLEYTPYVIGTKTTQGNVWTEDSHILNKVHAQPNEEIDSDELIEDLNWLNLNPYRNLEAVFEAGQEPGSTNIILRSQEQKPWSVWAGYNNLGTNGANPHRLFFGFDIANKPMIDHLVSYQYTASPNVYKSLRLLGLSKKDGYLSHSVNYFAPIEYENGARHKVKLQASFAQSYATGAPFSEEYQTFQTYGEYAVPLPLIASIRSELFGAVDYKHQLNETDFGGVTVNAKSLDILQLVAGIRGSFNTPLGFNHVRSQCAECDISRGDFDLRLIASPGGLTSNNSNAAFAAMSNNPTASSSYIYATGKINHALTLPGNFTWRTSLTGQWGNKSLPNIEKFALGGTQAVRGYQTGEFAGDSGFTFSNELAWPPVTFSGEGHKLGDRLTFWGFVDTGVAYDRLLNTSEHFLSAGAGFDYTIGPKFTISFAFSNVLKDGPLTKAGDKQVFGGFKFRY